MNSADLFLLHFCRQVEEIYGWEACTSNMHLHLHLKKTFEDYGPAHSFWCFSFERYNGILGSYHTNKKSVEVQLMKKFCTQQLVHSLPIPDSNGFSSIIPNPTSLQQTEHFFSLSNIFENADLTLKALHMPHEELRFVKSFQTNETITPIPPFKEKVLSSGEVRELKHFYGQFYERNCNNISCYCIVFGRVLLAGDLIGSMQSGTSNSSSSIIMANWSGSGDDIFSVQSNRMRVGEVQYFMKHVATLESAQSTSTNTTEHIFAYVHWQKIHPNKDWFGTSATVCTELYELSGCSFLPVQRIACRCAHGTLKINFDSHTENVFVACPVPVKYCI